MKIVDPITGEVKFSDEQEENLVQSPVSDKVVENVRELTETKVIYRDSEQYQEYLATVGAPFYKLNKKTHDGLSQLLSRIIMNHSYDESSASVNFRNYFQEFQKLYRELSTEDRANPPPIVKQIVDLFQEKLQFLSIKNLEDNTLYSEAKMKIVIENSPGGKLIYFPFSDILGQTKFRKITKIEYLDDSGKKAHWTPRGGYR